MNECRLCHQQVDDSRGRHVYGCLKVGNVTLQGLLEGYSHSGICSVCRIYEKAIVALRTSKGIDYYYCAECAKHPLKHGQRGIVNPFQVFVAACYPGKYPRGY